MRQRSWTAAVLVLLPAAPGQPARAESRGRPWTQEQLLSRSAEVFVGEVVQTRRFARYNRTVPTRARVLRSIKGNVQPAVRDVVPKDPGKSVYFDAEFDQAVAGRKGVFYVGTKENPDLLLGYRETAAAGEPRDPGPAPEISPDFARVEWVRVSLRRMQSVRAGMTRADLLRVFTTEGGLSGPAQRSARRAWERPPRRWNLSRYIRRSAASSRARPSRPSSG